jgi:endonuclease G
MPQTSRQDVTLLCRQGYFTLHDNAARIPAWTAWTLLPERVNGCAPRTNAFVADQSLRDGVRATPQDYAGSGFDQGHVANDAHQSWDTQVEYESFLMSNMVPQYPQLNRGIYKLLETATGAWSYQNNATLVIYAGSIYNASNPTIGANRVVVPSGSYKIVINTRTNEYAGWLFPNVNTNQGNDLTKFRVSVAQIEQLSGVRYGLPTGGRELAQSEMWPMNFGALTQAKRQICGARSTD